MASCKKCSRDSEDIAEVLFHCADCIRKADEESLSMLADIHAHSRQEFSLPAAPPSNPDGIECGLCQNNCRIPVGGRGYCGVRRNENGQIKGGTPAGAAVSWYHDPLPTNCVADWVCAGGSGAGYPQWAHRRGPEQGYMNLAVFYQACTFNCLFCQNWHYREKSTSNQMHTAKELAGAVVAGTSCICFFGGDPTCQLPHALAASRMALKQNQNRILRICWETNGSVSPELLDEMMHLSVESGGCVKFDLSSGGNSNSIIYSQAEPGHTVCPSRISRRLFDDGPPRDVVEAGRKLSVGRQSNRAKTCAIGQRPHLPLK